jgi:hypothetical protein
MTALLDRAVRAAAALPEAEQDALGSILLREIESERHWDELFSRYPEQLARIAEAALAEDERASVVAQQRPERW